MKIAISGASGFIGTRLADHLSGCGHQIVPLRRTLFADEARGALIRLLAECDGVINLAGATLNKRWTRAYKQQIYDSRVQTTRALVGAVATLDTPPALFISASAVGYYPEYGCYTEADRVSGTGFLASVCRAWEQETQWLPAGVRRAIARFGVVLAPDGGAFPKLSLPARWGVSVAFTPEAQPFAWIDLDDLLRAMELIVSRPDMEGIFNFVAPQRLTNGGLAKALALRYRDPLTLPVPQALVKLAMGEASVLLTQGACVHPEWLLQAGFDFTSPRIQDFLGRI